MAWPSSRWRSIRSRSLAILLTAWSRRVRHRRGRTRRAADVDIHRANPKPAGIMAADPLRDGSLGVARLPRLVVARASARAGPRARWPGSGSARWRSAPCPSTRIGLLNRADRRPSRWISWFGLTARIASASPGRGAGAGAFWGAVSGFTAARWRTPADRVRRLHAARSGSTRRCWSHVGRVLFSSSLREASAVCVSRAAQTRRT